MTTKVCSKCGEEKDIDAFYKDSKEKDGKSYYCKTCACLNAKLHRLENAKNHRLGVINKVAEKKCSICGEIKPTTEFSGDIGTKSGYRSMCKCCEYPRHREYWKNTKKDRNAQQKRHYNENIETMRDISRKFYHSYYKFTDKFKVTSSKAKHNRRLREANVECTLTSKQWSTILKSYNNRCAICGVKFTDVIKPTVDHIIPVSKGGGLTFENVQPLCRSCNSSKNNRLDLNNIVSWGIYDTNTA